MFYANQVLGPVFFLGNIVFLKGDNLKKILVPVSEGPGGGCRLRVLAPALYHFLFVRVSDRFVNVNRRFFCSIEIPSITLLAVTQDTETARINNGYPRIGN